MRYDAELAQLVECLLAMQKVESSNLLFRSNVEVAEWSGNGLQNRMRVTPYAGSNPVLDSIDHSIRYALGSAEMVLMWRMVINCRRGVTGCISVFQTEG